MFYYLYRTYKIKRFSLKQLSPKLEIHLLNWLGDKSAMATGGGREKGRKDMDGKGEVTYSEMKLWGKPIARWVAIFTDQGKQLVKY